MPSPVLIAVADAIVAEIAAADFGQEMQPERSYADWDTDFLADEERGKIHVDVVPVSARHELFSRGSWMYTIAVDVGLRKRFDRQHRDENTGRISLDEVDEMILLTQRIGEYFAPCSPAQDGRRLTALPEAVWAADSGGRGEDSGSGSNFRFWYFPDHLRQNGQYTGVIRMAYDVPRGVGE